MVTVGSDKKVILNSEVVKPEIKLADINEYGIEEFIAEGKSDYTHSIPQRVHNLILAASKFNGVLIFIRSTKHSNRYYFGRDIS